MSRPINEPFPRRINLYRPRQRRRINWGALVLPVYFAAMLGVMFYACNKYRLNADRAVDQWARQVGVE